MPEEEKRRRLDELMTLQSAISLEFNRSRIGTVERVLVDDVVGDTLVCRSQYESPEVDGEILVPASSVTPAASVTPDANRASLVGSYITVRISEADEYDLKAEVV